MQADLRIASEGSAFGIPAAKLGIAYGFDMVSRLISLVGQAHARMLLFTGDRIDAGRGRADRVGKPESCRMRSWMGWWIKLASRDCRERAAKCVWA